MALVAWQPEREQRNVAMDAFRMQIRAVLRSRSVCQCVVLAPLRVMNHSDDAHAKLTQLAATSCLCTYRSSTTPRFIVCISACSFNTCSFNTCSFNTCNTAGALHSATRRTTAGAGVFPYIYPSYCAGALRSATRRRAGAEHEQTALQILNLTLQCVHSV